MINWSYGITTVPQRSETLLPRTIVSLEKAKFGLPQLFTDFRPLGVYGNWALCAWQLYLRNPFADVYVIFQDDIVVNRNLKLYLEHLKYPVDGYFNLMTWPENEELAKGEVGWFRSNQKGRSACGLLFPNDKLRLLLQQKKFVEKARDRSKPGKCVDGMILEAMRCLGLKEYCHYPSLLAHTGDDLSSTNNRNSPQATSFRGEDFDSLAFLEEIDKSRLI